MASNRATRASVKALTFNRTPVPNQWILGAGVVTFQYSSVHQYESPSGTRSTNQSASSFNHNVTL